MAGSPIRPRPGCLQELIITYQNTVLAAQQEVEDNLAAFLKAQDQAGFLAQSVSFAKTLWILRSSSTGKAPLILPRSCLHSRPS